MWLLQQRGIGENETTETLFEAVTRFRDKVDIMAKRTSPPRP